MSWGKKKSYPILKISKKRDSTSVGKYTKKTEKSIMPSSSQSSTISATPLINKYNIPKEVKKKQKTPKNTLKICIRKTFS